MSEKHKIAAALRGAERTKKIFDRVTQAMKSIQSDMQANDGIYPHNGGAVSMAELARRAAISESSFYKKDIENIALKEHASLWLDSLKKKEIIGRVRVKKSLVQRSNEWKDKFHCLEKRHICTELELQSLEAKIQLLQQENTALIRLLKKYGETVVVPLDRKSDIKPIE